MENINADVDNTLKKEDLVENSSKVSNEILEEEMYSVTEGILEPISIGDQLSESQSFIKKSNKKVFIFTVILIGALLLFTTVSQAMVRVNPVFRTYNGLKGLYKDEVSEFSLRFETDVDKVVEEILENILITYYFSFDTETKDMRFALTSIFEEETILDVVFMKEDGFFYLTSPQIYEGEHYYVDYKDLQEDTPYEDFDEDNLDELKVYFDMIDYDSIDVSDYTDAIYEEIEEHIESDFSKVTYELDLESIITITKEIMDIVEEDDELFQWLQTTAEMVLGQMIEDGFELEQYDLTEDIIEEGYDYITSDDFEDQWEETLELAVTYINEIENRIEEDDYEKFIDFELICTYHFDLMNHVKAMTFEVDIDDIGSFKLFIDYDNPYDFKSVFKDSDGKDLTEDILDEDYSEIEDIGEDIKEYFEDYIDDHEEFEEFIESFEDINQLNSDILENYPLDILNDNTF